MNKNQTKLSKPAEGVIGAAIWGYGGTAAKAVIQLSAQAILARILGPGEYGVFAIGIMITSLSIFIAESGTGASLIQRKHISTEIVRFAFTIQLVLGLIVAFLVWLSAGVLGAFYSEPRAALVIQALSPAIFITAIGSISSSLLKKRLDFKSLQIGQVLGFFIGYILFGIPAAMHGAGVWSLVIAWLVQVVVTTFYCYSKTQHPCKLLFSVAGGAELLRFGGATVVSNLATWAGGYVDKIVVGRAFTTSTLGLYTIPFTFLGTLAAQAVGTLQPVLFSASSQVNQDKAALAKIYLGLLEGFSLLLLPVFITIAVIPEIILGAIYGPLWLGAAEIMRAASIGTAAYMLSAISTPILWALARVRSEAKAQLGTTVLILLVSVPLSHYSSSAIAWGVAVVSFGRLLWVVALLCKALELRWQKCLNALFPALVASGSCSLTAAALNQSDAGNFLNSFWLLILSIFCSASTLVVVTLLMRRRLLSDSLDARIDSILRKIKGVQWLDF